MWVFLFIKGPSQSKAYCFLATNSTDEKKSIGKKTNRNDDDDDDDNITVHIIFISVRTN